VRIKRLTLESFRGATQQVDVHFDPTKAVVLIFGENGTGKSTISDGIDFICNRRYGSLDDRSMSEKPKTHIVSLGQNPKNIKVSLSTTSGDFSAVLSKEGPSVLPSTGCPEARILRRSNILKLLEAQPKERFETLKTFIAISGIEKSENALRSAQRGAKAAADEASRSYLQARDELEKLWVLESKPGASATEWATTECEKDISGQQKKLNHIDKILPGIEALKSKLAELLEFETEFRVAKEILGEAEDRVREAESKLAASNAALLKLLEDAREYLLPLGSATNCPVCEQEIGAQALVSRLAIRIAEMSELATVAQIAADAKRSVFEKETIMVRALGDCCTSAATLGKELKVSELQEIDYLGINWDEYEQLIAEEGSAAVRVNSARKFSTLVLPSHGTLTEQRQATQKSINQRNALLGHRTTYSEKGSSATQLSNVASRLAKALEVVVDQRKSYIETALLEIATEVERLYAKLHPGEGIGQIRFHLKPNTIGSLDFDARFQDASDVPPQAYYSESHLDTLGICVFIALAKRYKGKGAILVLDDVVTSVDGPHLDRFMQLVHEESSQFDQIIVTTHYRPWKDRYRYARGPMANTQIVELRRWTRETGIRTDLALSVLHELKAALTSEKFERQIVASKAGIQLENVLDFLTFTYRSKLPRQADPNYTLGDLAGGIDTRLGKVLRVLRTAGPHEGKSEVLLKELIDKATSKNWVRNEVGCHFNSMAADVTDSEIREFAEFVVQLSDKIICEKCGQFPDRRPTGSSWQCPCGEVELLPLVNPGTALGSIAPEA
jgi:recombinational DNA repair ATPase RecF